MPLEEIGASLATSAGVSLLDKLARPFLAPAEDAHRYVVEWAKKQEGVSLTSEEVLAVIVNSPTIVREAKNKTAVLQKARELMAKPLKAEEQTGAAMAEAKPPEEDWLAYFFDKVKNISDADVQQMWARLLANECRQEGSVQKKLLDTLAMLDGKMATAFTGLCRVAFLAPGILQNRKAKSLVPLVLPPAQVFWQARQQLGKDVFMQVEPQHYIDAVKQGLPVAENWDGPAPYREYCCALPSFAQLVVLEELGLVRLHDGAPHEEFVRQLTCSVRITLQHDLSSNQYSCNSRQFQISCPPGDRFAKGPNTEEINHHVALSCVEFTTVGKQLCQAIVEAPLPGMADLLRYHIEAQGYTVTQMDAPPA